MTRALQFAGLIFCLVSIAAAQETAPCAASAKLAPCADPNLLPAEPAAVATLDGAPITLDDLDEATRKKIEGLDAAIAAARKKALRENLDDLLLRREAARRRIAVGQLLETEVLERVSHPSDADVAAEIAAHPDKYKDGQEDSEWAAGRLFDQRTAAREKELLADIEKRFPLKDAETDLHVETAVADVGIAALKAQKLAVEKVVHDRLLRAESARQGITPEELDGREVTSKITPVTDAELKKEWETWKFAYGDDFEKVRASVAESVQDDKKQALEKAFDERLRKGHEIRFLFEVPERPRQKVGGKRSGDAKVTLVEFGDFECPPCGRMASIVDEVLRPYGARVQYVFRQYPMSFHPHAWKAAEAALAARAQGKFDAYARILFANQKALEAASLKEYATKAGLDRKRFDEDLDSGRFAADVLMEKRAGDRAGVYGTPTFFLNGLRLGGDVFTADGMRAAIEKEIRRSPSSTDRAHR